MPNRKLKKPMSNSRKDLWDHIDMADGGYVDLANQLQTDTATIVEIVVAGPDYSQPPLLFTGTSRRDPRDKPNADIGYKLALGRALRAAGRSVLKDANKAVREQERQRQRNLQSSEEARRRRETRKASIQIGSVAQKIFSEPEDKWATFPPVEIPEKRRGR
jgi:hypothetical protein